MFWPRHFAQSVVLQYKALPLNQNVMKIIFLSMGLLLLLASTSCTPDNFASTKKEQIETLATDPPSEEPGEEVDPNGN